MLEDLRDHVAFRYLSEKIEGYRESALSSIARRLWNKEPVEQFDIGYIKGFYEGAMFVVRAPEEAAKRLDLEANRVFERSLEELETQNEGEAPYA